MELKNHIQFSTISMIAQLKIINSIELKDKQYDFLYGLNEKHSSFKRMFKELKRIIWRKM
jgi:hypothetical protein|tara:strand:- start:482 stop:661 length:180 start_codon:yes stop_codon:yes gene_type:complete